MKDGFVFLKTGKRADEVVALIADTNVLGEAGVDNLQKGFAAEAKIVMRKGVLTMTKEQLTERLPKLKEEGMHNSAKAFTRAIECIEKKTGEPSAAPAQKAALAHSG